MQSAMDPHQHHRCKQRAVELGRAMDPAALPELIELLRMPSTEIRRLAASACSKKRSSTSKPGKNSFLSTPATNRTSVLNCVMP